MLQRLLLASALLAALLSGCFGGDDGDDGGLPGGGSSSHDLMAGPALWEDPQNNPHPAYGWPTLSNPPAGAGVPDWWRPFEAKDLPQHISGITHVAQVGDPVNQGAGIALFGRLAVVPDDASEGHVVDITDPTHPVPLSTFESAGRGAAIIAYPDGRLVTVLATSPGFDVVEITDPLNPVILTQVAPSEAGHKLGVVPGTPFVYNAGSSGGEPLPNPLFGPGLCNVSIEQCTGYTSIYDLSDPEHPALVQEFQNGLACHHIFFWNALDGSRQRAICAGIQYTQIWDTADPAHPTVLVNVPVHHGIPGTPSGMTSIAAFSHTAGLSRDGTVLYVGDENMGGGLPPGCAGGAQTPPAGEGGLGGTAATPVGATWFYDVSTETEPQLLAWYSPTNDPTVKSPTTSCTTHHGRLVPDLEGRDLLAMSYYGDGVILLDFSDPASPKAVDQWVDGTTNTWETWYYGGYLFTGDLARGMDVLEVA